MRSVTACFQEPAEPAPIVDLMIDDGIILKQEGILFPITRIDFTEFFMGITIAQPLISFFQFITRTTPDDVDITPVAGSNMMSHMAVYTHPAQTLGRMHKGLLLTEQQFLTCALTAA